MNIENQPSSASRPLPEETCEHYVRFLLELTDYDFDLTARILNVLRNVPTRELRKQVRRALTS